MMTFRIRLRKISKPKHKRLKFDHEKLKDLNVLETFQALSIALTMEQTTLPLSVPLTIEETNLHCR